MPYKLGATAEEGKRIGQQPDSKSGAAKAVGGSNPLPSALRPSHDCAFRFTTLHNRLSHQGLQLAFASRFDSTLRRLGKVLRYSCAAFCVFSA